jgi:hypothetical protein
MFLTVNPSPRGSMYGHKVSDVGDITINFSCSPSPTDQIYTTKLVLH